jgi:hypothetical protein
MQFKYQYQYKSSVPRDTNAIKAPKVPVCGFNPVVFRPLTIFPTIRVLGVSLANDINELMLNRNALTVCEFNCASYNGGWDFRRKSASNGTSPSRNNGPLA